MTICPIGATSPRVNMKRGTTGRSTLTTEAVRVVITLTATITAGVASRATEVVVIQGAAKGPRGVGKEIKDNQTTKAVMGVTTVTAGEAKEEGQGRVMTK